MRHAATLGLILAICACRNGPEDRQGTIVGNPGDAMVRIAQGSEAVVLTDATALATDMVYTDCNLVDTVVEVDAELDLLDGTLIELQEGEWCELHLQLGELLFVDGELEEGGSFMLELAVPEISLTRKDFILRKETMYVFELSQPGWIEGPDLGIPNVDDTVLIDSFHELHDALAEATATKSALFIDTNGDGETGGVEREFNEVAAGPKHVTEQPDKEPIGGETGCGAGKSDAKKDTKKAGLFGPLLLLALAFRCRRKRTLTKSPTALTPR